MVEVVSREKPTGPFKPGDLLVFDTGRTGRERGLASMRWPSIYHHGIYIGLEEEKQEVFRKPLLSRLKALNFRFHNQSSHKIPTTLENHEVIHFDGWTGRVKGDSLANFAKLAGDRWGIVKVQNIPNAQEPRITVERAVKALEEGNWPKYNVLTNNCEHFVTYCQTGVKGSVQVGTVKEYTGTLVATATTVLLGGVVIAFGPGITAGAVGVTAVLETMSVLSYTVGAAYLLARQAHKVRRKALGIEDEKR